MLSPITFVAMTVAVGFTVEATVGFGATLLPLALGSLVMPTTSVLFRVVPLNLALSALLVARAHRSIDTRALVARILPAMALGLPVGLFALDHLAPAQLQRVFAAFVFVLAAVELAAMTRRTTTADAPRALSAPASLALLFVGGVAHGALATGGPPVVYVCARTLPDKATFRATLSALWLLLNVVVVGSYVIHGQVTVVTLRDSVPLVPGLLVGLALGEVLHGRVPDRAFRVVVFVLLLVVAVVLGVRA